MSRKRFIDPSMWQDASIAKMSHEERLLFVGMISVADDEGRLCASPSSLLGAIFPNDNGHVTPRQVQSWRDGVASKCPNVVLYEHEGLAYISLKRWERYQKPSHASPSKLPKPSRSGAE